MLRDICMYLWGPPLTGTRNFYYVERMIERYRRIITISVIWLGICLLLFEETQSNMFLFPAILCAITYVISQNIMSHTREEMLVIRHPDLLIMRHWNTTWFMWPILMTAIFITAVTWYQEIALISWWNYVCILIYIGGIHVIVDGKPIIH